MASWDCPVCTLRNAAEAPACLACGQKGPLRAARAMDGDEGDACPRCSFINKPGYARCDACGINVEKQKTARSEASLACGLCTFVNPPSSLVCNACGARIIPKLPEQQPSLPVSSSSIACAVCTFINSPGFVKCEMCGSPVTASLPNAAVSTTKTARPADDQKPAAEFSESAPLSFRRQTKSAWMAPVLKSLGGGGGGGGDEPPPPSSSSSLPPPLPANSKVTVTAAPARTSERELAPPAFLQASRPPSELSALVRVFARQNRDLRGGFIAVRERYLRPDVTVPTLVPRTCWVLPTASTWDRYLDTLDQSGLPGVIVLGSVLARLRAMGFVKTLRRVGSLLRDPSKLSWILFMDEFCPAVPRRGTLVGETLQTVAWLGSLLSKQSASLIVLSENDDFRREVALLTNVQALSCLDFVRSECDPRTSRHLLAPEVFAKTLAVCESTSGEDGAGRFEAHWTPLQLEQRSSALVKGTLMISPRGGKGEEEATVANVLLHPTPEARNRAMHGDLVAVDPVARRVVAVLERNPRMLVATLTAVEAERIAAGSSAQWHVVTPMDARLPLMRIKTRLASALVGARFVVKVDDWPADSSYPSAHYVRTLGPAMQLETESSALLLETGLEGHEKPFAASALVCLPKPSWVPRLDDDHSREDCTMIDVVSIDPVGCQDIDDALSLTRRSSDGVLELGVHIADVAYFVESGSALDAEARARATSVYLEDRRLDMLPARLCEDLASLRPGLPRLALSVFWPVAEDDQLVGSLRPRMCRTLIRSRYALSYEQAQRMADGLDPGEAERKGRGWTGRAVDPRDVPWLRHTVRGLMRVARACKARRVGGLELDAGGEFSFDLDSARMPVAVHSHDDLEVHDTIAELMILANEAVAARLLQRLPHCALIRHHPPANEERFKAVKEFCTRKGVSFECSSNKQVAESLERARKVLDQSSAAFLDNAVTRAMSEAQYASGGAAGSHYHYGLGLETYTHFTSPIRRYADLIVARQLLYTLNVGSSEPVPPIPAVQGAVQEKKQAKEIELDLVPVGVSAPLDFISPLDLGDDLSWADALGPGGGERDDVVAAASSTVAAAAAAAAPVPTPQPPPPPPLPLILAQSRAEDFLDPLAVEEMCAHINAQHRAAKDASARSQDLFFSLYFKDHPLTDVPAVVQECRPLRCFLPDFALSLPLRLDQETAVESEDDDTAVLSFANGTLRTLRRLDAIRVAVVCEFDPGLPGPRPPRPQLTLLENRDCATVGRFIKPLNLGSLARASQPPVRTKPLVLWKPRSSAGASTRPKAETCVRKGPGRVAYGGYHPTQEQVADVRAWDELEEGDDLGANASHGLSATRASASELRRAEREAVARLQKVQDRKYDARVKQRKKDSNKA